MLRMRKRRRRFELATTDNDEGAIAPAAITGLRKRPVNGYSRPSAIGMPRIVVKQVGRDRGNRADYSSKRQAETQ